MNSAAIGDNLGCTMPARQRRPAGPRRAGAARGEDPSARSRHPSRDTAAPSSQRKRFVEDSHAAKRRGRVRTARHEKAAELVA